MVLFLEIKGYIVFISSPYVWVVARAGCARERGNLKGRARGCSRARPKQARIFQKRSCRDKNRSHALRNQLDARGSLFAACCAPMHDQTSAASEDYLAHRGMIITQDHNSSHGYWK